MRRDRYLIRAVKYFLLLVILIAALYALNWFFEKTPVDLREYLSLLQNNPRSKWLLPVLVAISLAYPSFGYMTRTLPVDAGCSDGIERALAANGFVPKGERDGRRIYRAASQLRRARLLWEDEIEVWPDSGQTVMRGNRSALSRIIYSAEIYLRNDDK